MTLSSSLELLSNLDGTSVSDQDARKESACFHRILHLRTIFPPTIFGLGLLHILNLIIFKILH